MQTNVLIKEECILKNKNKSCAYKKLSVFYNTCLKNFGSHLLYVYRKKCIIPFYKILAIAPHTESQLQLSYPTLGILKLIK